MHARGRWRWLRTALLALALTLVASNLAVDLAWPDRSVAVAEEKDDDEKDNKNRGNDDDDDHAARGQVIGIDTLKDPPELTLAGMDGEMTVRVLKTDEIVLNGVRLCWHVKVQGEKIHEQLFEATQIEVETRKKC
jgi:hypothetical protein